MSLKEVRKERGLSQAQLSELSEVNVRMIQYYEQGVKNLNHAHLETLLKLSIALNCKMEQILTDDELKKIMKKYENLGGK